MKYIGDFLVPYKIIIEPGVFEATQRGEDKAIYLVLGVIHHKTLEDCPKRRVSKPNLGNYSYKNVLLKKSDHPPNPKLGH